MQPALGGSGAIVVDLLGGQTFLSSGSSAAIFAGPISVISMSSETTAGTGTSSQTVSMRTRALAIAPSLDVFVTDHLSLGGVVSVGAIETTRTMRADAGTAAGPDGSGSGYAIALEPRVGYAFPFAATWAFWPRVSASYGISRSEMPDVTRALTHEYGGSLVLGFVHRIGTNLVVDLGPTFGYGASVNDLSEQAGPDGQVLLPSQRSEYAGFGMGVRFAMKLAL